MRQLLGQSADRYVRQYLTNHEKAVQKKLLDVLRQLLPKAAEADIQKGVTKFVTKAVGLKSDLTEEQATYRFYWVKYGDRPESGELEVYGDGGGPVLFCTFPGFARMVKDEGFGKSFITLSKASAIFKGSFK